MLYEEEPELISLGDHVINLNDSDNQKVRFGAEGIVSAIYQHTLIDVVFKEKVICGRDLHHVTMHYWNLLNLDKPRKEIGRGQDIAIW